MAETAQQVLTGEMGFLSPRGGGVGGRVMGSLLPKGSDREHLY